MKKSRKGKKKKKRGRKINPHEKGEKNKNGKRDHLAFALFPFGQQNMFILVVNTLAKTNANGKRSSIQSSCFCFCWQF